MDEYCVSDFQEIGNVSAAIRGLKAELGDAGARLFCDALDRTENALAAMEAERILAARTAAEFEDLIHWFGGRCELALRLDGHLRRAFAREPEKLQTALATTRRFVRPFLAGRIREYRAAAGA